MVNKRYIPRTIPNRGKQIAVEKHLLETHYSFLEVKLQNGIMECVGTYQPSEQSQKYKYRIKYTPGSPPKVFIISPRISYDANIHMYSDSSLCLYYPKDFSWTKESHLYNTFVPWTHEWFVFYELYLLTGEWKHPFVDHNKI